MVRKRLKHQGHISCDDHTHLKRTSSKYTQGEELLRDFRRDCLWPRESLRRHGPCRRTANEYIRSACRFFHSRDGLVV